MSSSPQDTNPPRCGLQMSAPNWPVEATTWHEASLRMLQRTGGIHSRRNAYQSERYSTTAWCHQPVPGSWPISGVVAPEHQPTSQKKNQHAHARQGKRSERLPIPHDQQQEPRAWRCASCQSEVGAQQSNQQPPQTRSILLSHLDTHQNAPQGAADRFSQR